MKTTAQTILEAPLNELANVQIDPAKRQEIEEELSAIAQRAAHIAAYIGERFNTGCGERTHKDAAKVANKRLTQVRRAMGYSYPDRHATL